VAALAVIAVLLAPRRPSARALRARNRILVKPGERSSLHGVSALPGLRGTVLAPEGLGIRLPAWTSRLPPLCGIVAIRGAMRVLLRRCAAASRKERRWGRRGGAAARAQRALRDHGRDVACRRRPARAAHVVPALLPPGELALYEWRPLLWSEESR
jgi:hypothetical protein